MMLAYHLWHQRVSAPRCIMQRGVFNLEPQQPGHRSNTVQACFSSALTAEYLRASAEAP